MGTPQTLIGIYSSVPQSGKSTVARELTKGNGVIVSFAEPLKLMLDEMLKCAGYGPSELDHLKNAGKDEPLVVGGVAMTTYRSMLQTLGTEWGRRLVSPEIWVGIALQRVASYPEADLVVFDDVRFANEYRAIRNAGGKMVRLVRKGQRYATDHSSEGGLDRGYVFDEVLVNDGTLKQLAAKARKLRENWRTPV